MATSVLSKAVIVGTATAVMGFSGYLFTQRSKKDDTHHWKLKRVKGNKWRLTNTHTKPVVLWDAQLCGVAPQLLQVTFLSDDKVILPKQSIEIIIHRDSSDLRIDYTEYNDESEGHNAFVAHLRNPDVPYGKFHLDSRGKMQPINSLRQCEIRLWLF